MSDRIILSYIYIFCDVVTYKNLVRKKYIDKYIFPGLVFFLKKKRIKNKKKYFC